MEMTLADYHPAFSDPGVVLALFLAGAWLVAGGFLVFRPIFSGNRRFSWQRLALQVLGFLALLFGVRVIEAVTIRAAFRLADHPQANIVCAHWVQQSWLPHIGAALVLATGFSLVALRNRWRSKTHA